MRALRAHWEECPTCAAMYGGNGTKVPPGETCLKCGWGAPGKRGDDIRAAGFAPDRSKKARWRKAARIKDFKRCEVCGWVFIDDDTLVEHSIKRHPARASDDSTADLAVF